MIIQKFRVIFGKLFRTRHLQYRQKISIMILIFTLLPFITLGAFALVKLWKSKADEIALNLESQYKKSVSETRNMILTNLTTVKYINENPDLHTILTTDANNDFESVFISYLNVRSAFKIYLGLDDYSSIIKIYATRSNVLNGEFSLPLGELDTEILKELFLQKEEKILYKYMNIKSADLTVNRAETGEFLCIFKPIDSGFNECLAVTQLMIPFRNILNNFKFQIPEKAFLVYIGNSGKDKIILNSSSISNECVMENIDSFLSENTSKHYYIKSEGMQFNTDRILMFIPKSYIINALKPFILTTLFIIALLMSGIFAATKITSIKATKRLTKLLGQIYTDIDKLIENDTYPDFGGNDEFSSIHAKFFELINKIKDYYGKLSNYEIEKKSLELALLHERINPHLLYNSLSSIKWAFPDAKLKLVVDTMVNYYRITLNKGNEILKVSQEIEMIEEYLKLQRFAYKSDFIYNLEVDENIMDFQITKHLLQPFVENAILHGINALERGGIISILGKLENDKMVFQIIDNGAGMEQKKQDEIINKEYYGMYSGYGIKNILKRLELYYRNDYTFEINSELGKGTVVTIIIPVEKKSHR